MKSWEIYKKYLIFGFNNLAYFTSDKEMFEKAYQNNTKNFGRLLKHIFSLKRISLESTKKVIQHRMHKYERNKFFIL